MKNFNLFYSFIHAFFALMIVAVVWSLTGNIWAGAILSVGFFVGREHAQAEYKATASDFNGKWANMPWFTGFNPKYWSLDLALPIAAVSTVLFFVK